MSAVKTDEPTKARSSRRKSFGGGSVFVYAISAVVDCPSGLSARCVMEWSASAVASEILKMSAMILPPNR